MSAWDRCRFHCSLLEHVGDHALGQGTSFAFATILCHVRIPLVLLTWIREAVANCNTLEWHLLLPEIMRHCRDIVASIRLSEDVKVIVLVLRQCLVEVCQKGVHV